MVRYKTTDKGTKKDTKRSGRKGPRNIEEFDEFPSPSEEEEEVSPQTEKTSKPSTSRKAGKSRNVDSHVEEESEGKGKRFKSTLYERLFFTKFAPRNVAFGKDIKFDSFDENEVTFARDWFKYQKWDKLLAERKEVYPDLVKLFYTHFDEANKDPEVIHTWVKGKEIVITASELGRILQVPSSGLKIQFNKDWNEFGGVTEVDCSNVLMEDQESESVKVMVDELPMSTRLLLLFMQLTFISHLGRKSSMTNVDKKLMYCIVKKIKVNIPLLMIMYMNRAQRNTKGGCLPYCMWLTRVFKHFGVSLKNEVLASNKARSFDFRTISTDLSFVYNKDKGIWERSGVERAPKKRAVDEAAPQGGVDYGSGDDVPGTGKKSDVPDLVLETLVVQRMLKTLHPDVFTSDRMAELRAKAKDDLEEAKQKEAGLQNEDTPDGGEDRDSDAESEEEKSEDDDGYEDYNNGYDY